jgi:dienelactone hydrolase
MMDQPLSYQDENGTYFQGQIIYADNRPSLAPAVLVVHDWSGCNDFARDKARFLASLGYTAFAVDMYGEGKVGISREEKTQLMQPLVGNRVLVRQRMQAALKALTAVPGVDHGNIGAIGFCFGGLCVLDLARSGEKIQGAVSFHGLLTRPENLPVSDIYAKILVLHGYDDPMVPPEQVNAFAREMTQAKADWQIDMYGHTRHAFTNPEANDAASGTVYNDVASHRAFISMKNFFAEVFAKK